MTNRRFISRFSPNRTAPEDLEKIHVQRHALLDETVELVRESARTKNKHHLLFVGPRGCGKTHLLSLLNHRLSKQADLDERLRIAWLNEDETSTSFLELLVRIYQALAGRYPTEFPAQELDGVFGEAPERAREAIGTTILRGAGKRTILILVENLDGLFQQLDGAEQRTWRAFVQNHPIFATVATAQSLFAGVADQERPFFGFFDVRHLQPLSADDATELLRKIAALNNDSELESFFGQARGRARVRVLHHFAHGNHRFYVVLSELITADALDRLVQPFEEMVDEQLTPYYQERLRWLSPLQRRIVELLCQQSQPIAVKHIADRLFAAHTTITPQLKNLREMGYVVSAPRGRESLYELAEPLMRLSMQVKGTAQSEPLGVLVDFLRVWYEPDELATRTAGIDSTARIQAYVQAALTMMKSGEPNLRHEILRAQFEAIDLEQCDAGTIDELRAFADETEAAADWLRYGLACSLHGQHEAALEAFTKTMSVAAPQAEEYARALYSRYVAFEHLGQAESAMADCSKLIALPQASAAYRARALLNRGVELAKQGKRDESVQDYSGAIDLPEVPEDVLHLALLNRGHLLAELGRLEEAIADCTRVIDLTTIPAGNGRLAETAADSSRVADSAGASVTVLAQALLVRAAALAHRERHEDALSDSSRIIDLPGAWPSQVVVARMLRTVLLLILDRWSDAMHELSLTLSAVDPPLKTAIAGGVVGAIDAHFATAPVSKARAKEAVDVFAGRGALQELGLALVQHLSQLAAEAPADRPRQWLGLWESVGGQHPTLHLPLRLLRVGIDYLASQPRDPGKLLDLPAEERELLKQVLPVPG